MIFIVEENIMGLFSRAPIVSAKQAHVTIVCFWQGPHTHINPVENCLISFSLSCCFSFLNAFDLALAIASSSSWTAVAVSSANATASQIQTYLLIIHVPSFFFTSFRFHLIRRCAMSSRLLRLATRFLHRFKYVQTHSHIYTSIYFSMWITAGTFLHFRNI